MKLFLILLAIGIVLTVLWMFYSQRHIAYMSILLYRNGDADTYLKELDSFTSKLFFNKRLRSLMRIDAYLMKDDDEQIRQAFADADSYHLSEGDRMLVLQKEFSWNIEKEDTKQADLVFQKMSDHYEKMTDKNKKKYEEALNEAKLTKEIVIDRNGKRANEVFRLAQSFKEDIPAGVYYYRAAQAFYLQGEEKKAEECLNKAYTKLKGTTSGEKIKTMLDNNTLEGIMNL